MQIIIAILVFAVLVIVHEFGHFIVAKRSGVTVQEFAIGFPPRLWSVQRGETRYSINALPLGGYVLMPGENGELTDQQGQYDPHSFAAQNARKRAAILVAGVTMNLIFAALIYTVILAVVGQPRDPSLTTPIVGLVQSGTPAQAAGLRVGDRLITINGQPVKSEAQALDDVANEISADKTASPTVPVTLVVQRGSRQVTIQVNARKSPPSGQGPIGFGFQNQFDHPPLWQAPLLGLQQVFVGNFQATGEGIHQIIIGVVKPQQAFSGPVGIVNIAGQAAQDGPTTLFSFMAYLSWNLAIINLLPIPGLDGGRLLILGIEVLRRGRRLAPQREALINLIGMVFLLSLILLFTINDVSNIINGH